MRRLKMRCLCCGCDVELYRDSISGPDHYRCGNCFELVELDKLDDIAAKNKDLNRLEEQRNAILAAD